MRLKAARTRLLPDVLILGPRILPAMVPTPADCPRAQEGQEGQEELAVLMVLEILEDQVVVPEEVEEMEVLVVLAILLEPNTLISALLEGGLTAMGMTTSWLTTQGCSTQNMPVSCPNIEETAPKGLSGERKYPTT